MTNQDVTESGGWALYRVVYRTVGRAMDDASAKREKPPHPGLAFYLKEVG